MTSRELIDRSREAESAEDILDLIDAWVNGESSEATAVAIRLKLPADVLRAMDDIARRGPVPIAPAPRLETHAPRPERERDVVEAEIEGEPPAVDIEADDPALWDPKRYELHVLEHGFTSGGLSVSFEALGAPRLEHQTRDPVLCVLMSTSAATTRMQLTSGERGGALARVSDDELVGPEEAARARAFGRVALDNTPEAQVLRGFMGAAVIDTEMRPDTSVPILPNYEAIEAAMRAKLREHLALVRDQRERHRTTASIHNLAGMRFR